MICPVAEQISIVADEEEQYSACELLTLMKHDNEVIINGRHYELWQITDLIDAKDLREAAQAQIEGNSSAVYELYVNTVARLMSW